MFGVVASAPIPPAICGIARQIMRVMMFFVFI